MARNDIDLDVDTPEKVVSVLRGAAQTYYESAEDLSSSWQDPQAGKIWEKIAKILDKAADQIDKLI